jgi:hypothetical protein
MVVSNRGVIVVSFFSIKLEIRTGSKATARKRAFDRLIKASQDSLSCVKSLLVPIRDFLPLCSLHGENVKSETSAKLLTTILTNLIFPHVNLGSGSVPPTDQVAPVRRMNNGNPGKQT